MDGVEGWTSEITTTYANFPMVHYTYGTRVGGFSFEIEFRFYRKDPRNQDLIESTLASLKWKQ